MTVQERRRLLHTDFARAIDKPFRQAVREFSLLQADSRVAVCVSGGKDSFLLAVLLDELRREMPFSLTVLSMDPGFGAEGRRALERNAAALGLPLEIFETDVLRVAQNHAAEHPCFLCSKMRRGHLYAAAQARGADKIALGHHADDVAASILMGMLYGGQMQTMLPRVRAAHYEKMELIRPLYFVREQAVQEWAQACALTFPPCDCPAKALPDGTGRARVRALIDTLSRDNPQVTANILNSIKNVDTARLYGWRDDTGAHRFLDAFPDTKNGGGKTD